MSYSFGFTGDYASAANTLNKLNALQAAALANNIIVAFGASVGAATDAWNQAHQRAIPSLLTQAAQQAALVAAGMQVNVGPIVSVIDESLLVQGIQGRVALSVSFAIQ